MEFDGSPLDAAARALEDAVRSDLGVSARRVIEPEAGALEVRYSPVDLDWPAFADAVARADEEIDADAEAVRRPGDPGTVHEVAYVAVVTGLPAR